MQSLFLRMRVPLFENMLDLLMNCFIFEWCHSFIVCVLSVFDTEAELTREHREIFDRYKKLVSVSVSG
jgi:hypothetical protein